MILSFIILVISIEPEDFTAPAILNAVFSPYNSTVVCFKFIIEDDDCVEDKEYFEVYVTTNDSYVEFHIYQANVIIIDNDCEFLY